ncbi:MAG: DUF885 domain-containing protein [Candidatus Latescibacterota bacterium]|nr:MAG: DUF885 domain-containing protein [Candidatus Latescibacterota bacterium]
MPIRILSSAPRAVVCALATVLLAMPASAQRLKGSWVERSNANAQLLIEVFAKIAPEQAGFLGVPGLDEEILDLEPGNVERELTAMREALGRLRQRVDTAEHPLVRQDLEILIRAAERNIEGTEVRRKLQVPFFSVTSTVFQGLQALLDEQIEPERRPAALVRLQRYAGLEAGYEPIASLAEDRIRERLEIAELLRPVRDEVEKELGNSQAYVDGIRELFEKHGVEGYEEAYAQIKEQLAAYDEFVREEILPNARTDFRQPRELYALSLREFGVDMAVDELMSRAQVAFKEIQNQMRMLAPIVARQRGWDLDDYRDVIAELKKEQLAGEAILPHYEERMRELEQLIRDNEVVTLPERKMRIRLASEAESAAIPAPHMQPPRMIGNTGEMGTFILPLRIPGKPGEETLGFDDFTFEAASWTLSVHEGRPGHELQFASIVERGVSLARGLFAFNSVNVEGWALYAEAEMQPYEPLDGQLIALQHRLLRAARAFLDPGLQTGVVTQEQATRILRQDVGLSEAMALQEVERYTFRAPGQAPSYFVGYNRLLETRAMAERALGDSFDRRAFNDFVLSQGMLPPALLRRAVLEEFVPSQTAMR